MLMAHHLLKPGSQYDAGASVAFMSVVSVACIDLCPISIGERRRTMADAGLRKISIQASRAQRPSNHIVLKCHVTGRYVYIATR